MPSILNDDDKDTVKRFVPKQSNKIQAVAVARLYVAHPDPLKWTYTGIQGAIVLSNDLVGNTYWLKMVDISPANRGVIWDQEIFDSWHYNQDRTFFHTFELEDCLAALSFVDEKEAKQFRKKMDDREKNASKATRSTPFGGGSQPTQKHSLLGGLFGHRHSSAPTPDSSKANLPPPPPPQGMMSSPSMVGVKAHSEFPLLDAFDPLWREHFGKDLSDKGLTDDFIRDNQEFIVDFLREEQQKIDQPEAAPPSRPNGNGAGRAPPPPPPPAGGKKNGPPTPPAPRRSGKDAPEPPAPESPEPSGPKFKAPPPLADAGKFANVRDEPKRPVPSAPAAASAPSSGPPPPPRPAKTPLEQENESHKFNVPPAFTGSRVPPPTPSRGPVPPPPPRRNDATSAPPPLPPKVPSNNVPPPLPPTNNVPPPLPPSSSRPVPPPPAPGGAGGPPPPPPPPPPMPSRDSGGPPPPPPPPMPSRNAAAPPPPPPPMPSRDSGGPPAPALPASDKGRSAMLGDIEKAGGIGSLKKVNKSEIRDRSAALPGEGGGGGAGGSAAAAAGGGAAAAGGGGMADALAAALQKRKDKVGKSDDEDDGDDWD